MHWYPTEQNIKPTQAPELLLWKVSGSSALNSQDCDLGELGSGAAWAASLISPSLRAFTAQRWGICSLEYCMLLLSGHLMQWCGPSHLSRVIHQSQNKHPRTYGKGNGNLSVKLFPDCQFLMFYLSAVCYSSPLSFPPPTFWFFSCRFYKYLQLGADQRGWFSFCFWKCTAYWYLVTFDWVAPSVVSIMLQLLGSQHCFRITRENCWSHKQLSIYLHFVSLESS